MILDDVLAEATRHWHREAERTEDAAIAIVNWSDRMADGTMVRKEDVAALQGIALTIRAGIAEQRLASKTPQTAPTDRDPVARS